MLKISTKWQHVWKFSVDTLRTSKRSVHSDVIFSDAVFYTLIILNIITCKLFLSDIITLNYFIVSCKQLAWKCLIAQYQFGWAEFWSLEKAINECVICSQMQVKVCNDFSNCGQEASEVMGMCRPLRCEWLIIVIMFVFSASDLHCCCCCSCFYLGEMIWWLHVCWSETVRNWMLWCFCVLGHVKVIRYE